MARGEKISHIRRRPLEEQVGRTHGRPKQQTATSILDPVINIEKGYGRDPDDEDPEEDLIKINDRKAGTSKMFYRMVASFTFEVQILDFDNLKEM